VRPAACALALALVLVACGGDDDSDEDAVLLPPASETSPTTAPPTTAPLPEIDAPAPDAGACEGVTASEDPTGLELDLDIGDELVRDAVDWPVSVRNVGDESVTLVYPTGQDGDVAIQAHGEDVYRWSAGLAFSEALRCQVLEPGARYSFTLEGGRLTLADGEYEVIATLAADPEPEAAAHTVQIVEE
jgi:hypothetical protein